jgi:hypothetical protein
VPAFIVSRDEIKMLWSLGRPAGDVIDADKTGVNGFAPLQPTCRKLGVLLRYKIKHDLLNNNDTTP